MAGVWVFRNGVFSLVRNPKRESAPPADDYIVDQATCKGGEGGSCGSRRAAAGGSGGGRGRSGAAEVEEEEYSWAPPKKMLVYRATNEVISSYEALEEKLFELGWERCPSRDPLLRHYYRRENGPYLLTLPTVEFHSLKPIHLYNIVVQSRTAFEVRDIVDHHHHHHAGDRSSSSTR